MNAFSFNVANQPGRLASVLKKLSQVRINLVQCQFTTGNAKNAEVILNTNNNVKAAKILGIKTPAGTQRVLAGSRY